MEPLRRDLAAPDIPGRFWYVIAGILFLGSVIAAVAIPVASILSAMSEGTQFVVPGSVTINAEEKASWTLWNEVSGLYEGRTYSGSQELPSSMTIEIVNNGTGEKLSIESSIGSTMTHGSTVRHSIGDFEAPSAGSYTLTVSGDFPERIFYVRPSFIGKMMASVAGSIVLFGIGFLLSPVIAIIVYAKRSNTQTQPYRPTEGSPSFGSTPISSEPIQVGALTESEEGIELGIHL